MTPGRRRALLAVALLVAAPLAGCNTVPGSDPGSESGAGSDAPTVTPAPVPTDDPERDLGPASGRAGATVAPGIGEDGVVSAADLAAAHREALLATSFTRTVTEIIRGPNRTVRRTDRTIRAEFDPLTYYYVRNQTVAEGYPVRAFAPRFELWSNDSRAVSRVVRNGDVRYRINRASAFGEAITGITGDEALMALFGAFEFRVEPVDGGYRLRSTAFGDSRSLPTPTLTENASNATMTARISERGVVRSYRVAYDVRRGDRRLRVVERAEVRALGETTVERPEWFEAAVENATDDGSRS